MGVDAGHMSFGELAQAIPPAYASLVFAQMCMAEAHRMYGAPVITYDEMLRRPSWAKRQLALWLQGGGAPRPDVGLAAQPVSREAVEGETAKAGRPAPASSAGDLAGWDQVVSGSMPIGPAGAYVSDAEFRELFHSFAGGYERVFQAPQQPEWLQRIAPGGTSATHLGITPKYFVLRYNTLFENVNLPGCGAHMPVTLLCRAVKTYACWSRGRR